MFQSAIRSAGSASGAPARSVLRVSALMGALLLVFSLAACSKYQSLGPEFSVGMKLSRRATFQNGKAVQSTYTVESLKINGHPIELVDQVSSSQDSFLVDTRDYGPMKIKVRESANALSPGLSLLMTREQKEKIRALGKN
ncbi:MAG: hypothetical protein ACLQGV_16430 [Bryobacteraceae bacterium]